MRLLPAKPFWISGAQRSLRLQSFAATPEASLTPLRFLMSKARVNARKGETVWIYRPWLDLMVGCGAWSAPLLMASYLSSAGSTLTWSVVFYVLALFLNYPHYMATIYRAYHKEEDFRKYRIFTVHITLLVVLTLLLAHFWSRALPWIFTLYLTASPWHYSG